MGLSKFNTVEADIATAYRLTPPSEDIVDGTYNVGNKLSYTAGVEQRLTIGAAARHKKNGFNDNTGISMIFDIDNDVAIFSEFYDTPVIISKPNCFFQPSASNEGYCTIRVYVNETSPLLLDESRVVYKGNTPAKISTLFSFYIGSETGFDIKNKGVFLTFEFDHDGEIWDMALLQYLT